MDEYPEIEESKSVDLENGLFATVWRDAVVFGSREPDSVFTRLSADSLKQIAEAQHDLEYDLRPFDEYAISNIIAQFQQLRGRDGEVLVSVTQILRSHTTSGLMLWVYSKASEQTYRVENWAQWRIVSQKVVQGG